MIRIENIRDMTQESDVKRFLIDHEWPKDVVRFIPHKEKNGATKTNLALIEWRPQLAPTPALWKWFHRDPDKTGKFRGRYFRELQEKKKHWMPIAQESAKNMVTLLYHGKNGDYAPAHFFKEFLDFQLETRQVPAEAGKKRVNLSGRGVAVPVEKSISRKHKLPPKEKFLLR